MHNSLLTNFERHSNGTIAPDQPTEAQIAQLQALGRKSLRHGRISVLLLIIAIVRMSAARYL